MSKNKSIICPSCGKENNPNSKFCSECGTKLVKENTPRKKAAKTKKETTANTKVVSTAFLMGLIILLLAFSGFLLVISGQFDSPAPVQINNDNSQVNQTDSFAESHGGADLKTLQRIKELEDAVEKNPADLESLVNLAHLLNDNGFYKKAIGYYQKYISKRPKDADVLIDMGVCYFELEDYDKAIQTMEKAVSINPEHQIGNFNLGIVNYSAGNTEKAKYWWKKAIDIDPNSKIGQKAKELLENNN